MKRIVVKLPNRDYVRVVEAAKIQGKPLHEFVQFAVKDWSGFILEESDDAIKPTGE